MSLRVRRGTEGDGGGRIEGEWRRREEGQREDVPGLQSIHDQEVQGLWHEFRER